jgi:hypothetical protein
LQQLHKRGRPAAHVVQRQRRAETVAALVEDLERRPRAARERRDAGITEPSIIEVQLLDASSTTPGQKLCARLAQLHLASF